MQERQGFGFAGVVSDLALGVEVEAGQVFEVVGSNANILVAAQGPGLFNEGPSRLDLVPGRKRPGDQGRQEKDAAQDKAKDYAVGNVAAPAPVSRQRGRDGNQSNQAPVFQARDKRSWVRVEGDLGGHES